MFRLPALAVSLSVAAAALAFDAAAAAPAPGPDAPVGAAPGAPRFDIWEFEVSGGTAIPDTAVEAAVYPFLGEGRTVEDVEKARATLERAFHEAGYRTALVSIPEQAVNSGLVRLEVTEAPVERLRVLGARYHSPARMLEEAPSLVEGGVPHFPAMQEDLARLNRMPGRRVTPVLRPGARPGTTAIDLAVEDRDPFGGSVELNNNYSASTEKLRLTTTLRFDNLFQRLHAGSIQYQTAPQDREQVSAVSVSYLVPLARPGEFLSFFAARSRSDVAVLDTTSALGNGDIVGARWSLPLPGDAGWFHSLSFGAEYKSFKENLVVTGLEPVQAPIRYFPLSVSYNGGLTDAAGEWGFGAGLVFGVRGFGSDDGEFDNKQFGARSNFIALRWDASRGHSLGAWGGLYVAAEGQIANQALISNERFSAGGADSVRGYLQSEVLGDGGVRGTVEYRGPSLAGEWAAQIGTLTPFAFYDGAWLARKKPLAEAARTTIGSLGVGLRLRAFDRLAMTLNLAWPLKDQPAGDPQPQTEAHKLRVLFNTRVDF